jgi:hypothetical protein
VSWIDVILHVVAFGGAVGFGLLRVSEDRRRARAGEGK